MSDDGALTLLGFCLDGQRFCIHSGLVREVLPMLPLRLLSRPPPSVVGVVEVRGALLTVLDPRPRLHLPVRAPQLSSHLIHVECEGQQLCLLEDFADELFQVQHRDVCRPGELEARVPYGLGLVKLADGGDSVLVELDALVSHDEWGALVDVR